MNNETDIGIKFSASVNGNKKLQELASSLTTIKAVADGLNTGAIDSIEVSSNEMKEISKNTKNTANVMKLAFNFSTVRMFARTLGNVTKELTRLANKSSDYLENVNLFQVAFDGNYRSAERFINKLSEMYGLDESRLTRVVGIFKQLSNAMNVSAETGEKLAKLMTQMSLDISSLYNVDFERSVSVLQSAISGQTKPIRGTTGADITQSTLQTTLDSLGIDRAVNQLTFAEKRLLIIISLTQQLKEATNDLGRTIESPANQLKVLSEQWQRLSRALGNTFLPILAKILPYLNAIMMVLTEIINMIAKLFGYKEDDYDYFSGTDEAVMNLEDSLGKATAGVGKLKKALTGLRSFDRLNVISTPASGGGGGGSAGLGSGMDPDLLKAFNNAFDTYQDKLENVRMKASKIRDSIMEWLGFTKELDPVTGKIVWKYQGFKKTLSNVLDWFKKLSPLAKTLVGYLTYLAGAKIVSGISKLFGIFTNSKIGKSMGTMVTSFWKILDYSKELTAVSGSAKQGIFAGVDYWNKTASGAEKVATAIGGIVTAGAGLVAVSTSMKNISDNGMNMLNTFGLVSGSMSSMFGGMMTGISLTGSAWGGLVGGIIGGIGSIITAWLSYETEEEKQRKKAQQALQEVKDTAKEIQKEIADTELEITSQMAMTNYHERLVNELDTILDKNGKIKSGYEDRAKFILEELSKAYGVEYSLVDGTLQNSKQTTDEIRKQIDLKEQQILLEAYEEDYVNALKEENRLEAEKNRKIQERNDYYADQDIKLQSLADAYGLESLKLEDLVELQKKKDAGIKLSKRENAIYTSAMIEGYKSVIKNAEDYDKAVDIATQNYQNNADIQMRYSALKTAVETGDIKKIQEATEAFNNAYMEGEELKTFTAEQNAQKRMDDAKVELDWQKRFDREAYESFKKSLTDQIDEMDQWTPEMTEKWMTLGNTSADDFIEEMKKIPDGMREKIISEIYNSGYEISSELQRGLNAFDVSKSIKVDADTTKAKTAINKLIGPNSSVGKALASIGIKLPALAVGGMPQVGQIFIANEKGPELVGNIGGQSFVANQNQMLDLLDKKIGNAQQKKEPTTINIYLDEQHKLGTYTLEQLEGMAKTIGKPIKIG